MRTQKESWTALTKNADEPKWLSSYISAIALLAPTAMPPNSRVGDDIVLVVGFTLEARVARRYSSRAEVRGHRNMPFPVLFLACQKA